MDNPDTDTANIAEPEAPTAQRALADIPQDALIILPTRNVVLFPGLVTPLNVGRETSIAAVQEAARSKHRIGVVLQRTPDAENPASTDLHEVGTAAAVLRYLTTPDGIHHVVAQGQQRFRIVKFLEGWPFLVARVELAHEAETLTPEIEARMIEVKKRAAEVLELIPQAPAELSAAVQDITLPGVLADFIGGLMDIPPEEKQAILATSDSKVRLDKVLSHLVSRLEVLRLSREISDQTQERLSKIAARDAAARAAEDDQPRARRSRRQQQRRRRACRRHRQGEHSRRGARAREEGAEAARADARQRRRILDAAHVPRVDDGAAVVGVDRRPHRHRRPRATCWTTITSASRRSSAGSSNTSPCAS